jgi:hypothetical protein
VIVEEHDIFGDGVNVAARLEALAEPVARNSWPIGSNGCNRPKLNPRKANPIAIRSEGWVETILVPAAAARNSSIAA